ncbi:hypothetical protein EV182_006628 [Spiromyces aspiralis]|uniref:Uncharacterized protein n=1 Tax=Spiromyces aspiralis TaxID=68401 RepID=A0ACC1H8I6_9FUNG|nr:hypothetical protein EV182_006628 [Spiromyces aspiralis]
MSAKDISDLWNQYHATKDCISAAIPADTYKLLQIKAKTHPMFILPLPHTEGIEFYILQFDYHQVHFTSLLEYKSNLSSARPHLSLIHYTDLADSKGIVLMRGEISSDPRMLTPQQAQFLALQMQQFYVTGGQEKQKLLETFTFHPQNFNYEQLIEAANKLD